VYSPLSFRHAQNIVESLISDLPRSLEVSVLEEPIVNEEVLSTIDFDILVTTQTLFLNIEQPIIFMYRTRSSHQYDELQYLIRKIAEQKEKNAREKFMNKKIPQLQDKKSKFNVITQTHLKEALSNTRFGLNKRAIFILFLFTGRGIF